MGRKHRETRKEVKAGLRRLPGWVENEIGELARKTSKAEARRVLLRRSAILQVAEDSLMDSITNRVREEICAQEDARVLEMIDQTLECGGMYAP
jgi:predicted transcriptional regulator